MKKLITTTALVLVALALVSFDAALKTESYKGYAYEHGSKDPMYMESFTDKYVGNKHTGSVTLYYNDGKKLIAKRSLDFSRSDYAPDFQIEDTRTGFMEGAEVLGENKVRLFFRDSKKSPLKEKTINVPKPMVIDGGFNGYIKANWDELMKGNAVTFYFTVSNKLDYYKLRAKKVAGNDQEVTVRIEPENSVMRMVAPQINVRYDVSSKRIISYEGKSNIQDENGSNPVVRLEYPKKGP